MRATLRANRALGAAVLVLTTSQLVSAQDFAFTYDQSLSGLNASTNLTVKTAGTLIGNWNPDTNPTGTRTKPGLFGPFGSDENVEVNTEVEFRLTGDQHSATSGNFLMSIDGETNLFILDGYNANFLAGGGVALGTEIEFMFDSFRTRNPTSLYIGGFPITIPLGDLTLTQLSATQIGPTIGLLTPTGPGHYSILAAPLVSLTAKVDLLGTEYELPATDVLLPFTGDLVVGDTTAQITSVTPIDLSETQNPDQALPEFAFDLPTIIPPGDVAHLLLNLLVSEVSASVNGSLSAVANGVLIPEPATAVLLACGAITVLRRRRAAR